MILIYTITIRNYIQYLEQDGCIRGLFDKLVPLIRSDSEIINFILSSIFAILLRYTHKGSSKSV